MSAPRPSKRRRQGVVNDADDGPRYLMVFFSPGLTPDVRFTMYDKFEYHLHSIVLKLHSRFFQRFLNSPEKSHVPASKEFQYEYVSAENEEGWVLEPKSSAYSPSRTGQPMADNELDRAAFEKLLLVFYSRPYTIESSEELIAMTKIADFYCSLPILSTTLTAALFDSPIFKRDSKDSFREKSYEVIFAAKQLRYHALFRECFVHIVGTWVDGFWGWTDYLDPDNLHRNRHQHGQDRLKNVPELLALISASHIDLCRLLLIANQELILEPVKLPETEKRWERAKILKESWPRKFQPTQNAEYYRDVYEHLSDIADPEGDDVHAALNPLYDLMTSNLALDKTGWRSGEGYYSTYFLCANISDEEMPWDPNEIDF